MNNPKENETCLIGAREICKRWWKKNKRVLLMHWRLMKFTRKERKYLEVELSGLSPYYNPNGFAYSDNVNNEYQHTWLLRSNEHPDLVWWM